MLRRVFCKLLLVAVVVFWSFSGVLFAQGRSEEAFQRVIAAQEKHTDVLMARPGVVGTAVGLNDQGKHVVMVLLEKAGVPGIPPEVEGIPVQVKVTGEIRALADPTARFLRPVPIGVSTGHPDITAGTIACRVTDGTYVYALSNNHVYANENNGNSVLDTTPGADNVLQPGPYDYGEDSSDAIGTLFDFVPIVFHPRASNVVDAAIALSSEDKLGYATPDTPEDDGDDGYGAPSSTTVLPTLGLEVKKYGRTTRLTYGEITGVNAAVRVSYDSGLTRFVGQIIIESVGLDSFSAGGDSGSLIVTDNSEHNPVGLLFAGSSSVTIANRIDAVLDAFGVTVDDGSGGGSTNQAPTADFSWSAVELTVTFTDESSDPDGDTLSYLWDFGDGGTSTTQNPSHTYASGGTYTVTLTVTDDEGATNTVSQDDVTVSSSGSGGGIMHVSAIDMWYSTAGPNYFIYTEVTILDESNDPVSEATVYLTTTLPNGSTSSGSGATGSDGSVTFKMKSRQTGTYSAEVTNVTHASLTYNAVANVETSETLTVP